jgi:signal peptidase I
VIEPAPSPPGLPEPGPSGPAPGENPSSVEAGAGLPSGGSPVLRRLVIVLTSIAGLLLILLVIRSWVLTPFRIPTSSMEPTLLGESPEHPGDTILVNRTAYLFSDPCRWDVVAFRSVEDPPEGGPGGRPEPLSIVKRIVGLPGETVEIDDGELCIDGRRVAKPSAIEKVEYVPAGSFGQEPLKLGPDEFYVLGDNPYPSHDSRRFGPLPRSNIFGRVEWIVLPWERRGRVR